MRNTNRFFTVNPETGMKLYVSDDISPEDDQHVWSR